jgi:hypothetical protein
VGTQKGDREQALSIDDAHHRLFFHSFPRPKATESEEDTLERGLSILGFMKKVGLVLAPEIVDWDVSVISGGAERLHILQRRACFTELSSSELTAHSTMFGPIALSFDISALRSAGATPVLYVPQSIEDNLLSQIGTFCVRGAYHTQQVLRLLEGLREISDPIVAAKRFGMPVDPNYKLNLNNTDSAGNVVASYEIPASNAKNIFNHVGFNNIPFDHSIGIVGVFLNMFYPTDNTHTGDQLGYYRQREWRLIAGDINFNGRPMGRSLSDAETAKLHEIDAQFWSRELMVDKIPQKRSDLALVYDPIPNWKFFDLVKAIFVPTRAVDRVRSIVGAKVTVYPHP